jgi:hypothetical protein
MASKKWDGLVWVVVPQMTINVASQVFISRNKTRTAAETASRMIYPGLAAIWLTLTYLALIGLTKRSGGTIRFDLSDLLKYVSDLARTVAVEPKFGDVP